MDVCISSILDFAGGMNRWRAGGAAKKGRNCESDSGKLVDIFGDIVPVLMNHVNFWLVARRKLSLQSAK